MTVTEMAPAEVEDLEAWLNHEIERPCEAASGITGEPWHDVPAEWLFVWSINCEHAQRSAFACSTCKDRWLNPSNRYGCATCHTPAKPHLVERTR